MLSKNVKLTLTITYVAIALVVVLAVALHWILNWYATIRVLLFAERLAVFLGYLCSLPLILLALLRVAGLLKNIQRGSVFVEENVRHLAIIRSCCLGIFAVCLAASFLFLPLLLVVAIMGFLSLMMQVLKQVMEQAVSIREENDLTV